MLPRWVEGEKYHEKAESKVERMCSATTRSLASISHSDPNRVPLGEKTGGWKVGQGHVVKVRDSVLGRG